MDTKAQGRAHIALLLLAGVPETLRDREALAPVWGHSVPTLRES